jgi:hypothetical protein
VGSARRWRGPGRGGDGGQATAVAVGAAAAVAVASTCMARAGVDTCRSAVAFFSLEIRRE